MNPPRKIIIFLEKENKIRPKIRMYGSLSNSERLLEIFCPKMSSFLILKE